jgi:hypothetical protein
MGVAGKSMQKWEIGAEVTCPKCRMPGRVGIDKFKAKGKVYEYIVVRHYVNGKVKRCVIGRAGEGPRVEVAAGPAVKEQKARAEKGTKTEVPTVPAAVEVPEPPRFVDETPIPEEVDKASWYVTKVAASWGSFRENPSQDNYAQFVRTVRQVSDRMNVPCEDVIAAVDYYFKVKSERARTIVNEAVKRFIARVIIANTAYYASAGPSQGPQFDIDTVREIVRAEIERVVSEIKGRIEVPEVTVTKEDYATMYSVFRQKKRVDADTRDRAYAKWEQIFKPGKKIVSVE